MDATKEPGEPDHENNPGGASIWFGWTPPATGLYRLTSCTSDFHNLFAVYNGTSVSSLGNEFPRIGPDCSTDFNPAFYSVSGAAGHELKIAIDGQLGFSGVAEGQISFSYAPTNDIFMAATDLGNGTTANATDFNGAYSKEPGEPNHAGNTGGDSAWYSWTAPTSGRYIVDLCGSDFDTLLGVYTGAAVDALTQVASNDDACGTQFNRSRLAFTTIAGTTYRVAVDGAHKEFANLASGILNLKISPVLGDAFADAQDLGNGTSATASGSNFGATKESDEPNHGGNVGGASVWYRWTAPQNGPFTVDTCGSSLDTVLGVYTGSAVNALSELGGDDDTCRGRSAVTFDAVSGTTYKIAVDGFKNPGALTTQIGSFDLHLNAGPPPDEDADGVIDFSDNCVSDTNPDQADLDQDGTGDVCDSDPDGDFVDDPGDQCPSEWGESLDGCPLRLLTLDFSGNGYLLVSDIYGEYICPDDFCEALYDDGDQATITAIPEPGSSLIEITGAGCSGTAPCEVKLDQDRDVFARFEASALPPSPFVPNPAPKARKPKKCKRHRAHGRRHCKKKKRRAVLRRFE